MLASDLLDRVAALDTLNCAEHWEALEQGRPSQLRFRR